MEDFLKPTGLSHQPQQVNAVMYCQNTVKLPKRKNYPRKSDFFRVILESMQRMTDFCLRCDGVPLNAMQ